MRLVLGSNKCRVSGETRSLALSSLQPHDPAVWPHLSLSLSVCGLLLLEWLSLLRENNTTSRQAVKDAAPATTRAAHEQHLPEGSEAVGEGVAVFNRHGAATSSLHSSLALVMALAQQWLAPPVFELHPCPPQNSHEAEQHLKTERARSA